MFRAAGWQPEYSAGTVLALSGRDALLAADADAWLAAQAGEEAAGIGGLCPAIDESRYRAAVERIKQFIYDGDCYQVNYTFPSIFLVRFSAGALRPLAAPAGTLRRLRRQSFRRRRLAIAGIVLERHGERLLTRPMKGTAARSSPSETLRNSVKDRAENLMIVDLLRNDLGRLAEPGSVKGRPPVPRSRITRRCGRWFPEVSASIGRQGFESVLRALFPCGSITGAPKIRAMQIIGELEGAPRCLYTGALGGWPRMETSG